jgi:hypothetical protein
LLLALKLLLRTLSFCYYPLNLLFEVLCRGTSIEPSESLCIWLNLFSSLNLLCKLFDKVPVVSAAFRTSLLTDSS